MAIFNCESKNTCTLAAFVASIIIGIVTAFLQITGVITVTPVFLWVVFGIAIVYLAVLVLSAARIGGPNIGTCGRTALQAVLTGILGSVLVSVILLAVGVVATSVFSAILSGLLLFFFSLTVTGTACLVKCLAE